MNATTNPGQITVTYRELSKGGRWIRKARNYSPGTEVQLRKSYAEYEAGGRICVISIVVA